MHNFNYGNIDDAFGKNIGKTYSDLFSTAFVLCVYNNNYNYNNKNIISM